MGKQIPWNYRPPQEPMLNDAPKHRSKKNTKKWCKGKVGQAHEPKWEYYGTVEIHYGRRFVCQNCGKHLDSWFRLFNEGPAPEIGSTEPLEK